MHRTIPLLLCLVFTVMLCTFAVACASSAASTTVASAFDPMPSVDRATSTSEALRKTARLGSFAELGKMLTPLPVFVLDELPEGVSVAEHWWPILESSSPSESTSENANPRVVDKGTAEPEGQLILEYGDGWLGILENVRGDLGDVAGEPVGEVEGMPAHVYELDGGYLVQWSFQGRWYAVFGRGIPRDVVISVALDMRLL